jgi:hypothetical protein
MPHTPAMALITVVETAAYLAKSATLLTEEERTGLVNDLASGPEVGDLIRGGGGIRKFRLGAGNRGKRGGVRVIYYYHSRRMPVFLLALFAKNERSDLSRDEVHRLAKAVKAIAKSYGA